MSFPARLPRRSSLRLVGAATAALIGLATLASCSSDGQATLDKPATTPAVSVADTVPSGPAGPGTAAQTTAPSPEVTSGGSSGTFTTQVLETPSSLLAATSTIPAGYTVSPPDTSIVAQANGPAIAVYKDFGDAKPFTTLQNPLPSGAPLTFLVDGQTPARAKVLLPIRPNGTTGWVNLADVRQVRNDYKLVVQLAEFRIQAYKGPEKILDAAIGIGTSETPTPGGRYYIKELLRPPNPNGVYGVYAYGLSGFSPVLTSFNGGEGVLGIHGTNRPDLLGQRVSKGCIRLRNEDITKLAKLLPLGTPVIVQT